MRLRPQIVVFPDGERRIIGYGRMRILDDRVTAPDGGFGLHTVSRLTLLSDGRVVLKATDDLMAEGEVLVPELPHHLVLSALPDGPIPSEL